MGPSPLNRARVSGSKDEKKKSQISRAKHRQQGVYQILFDSRSIRQSHRVSNSKNE